MKENNEGSTRRQFAAGSTLGLGSLLIAKPELVRGSQANSALTLGVIGTGNRGMYVSGLFAKNEYLKVTAICDIYDDRLAEAESKYTGARKFKNYKELLASDVDAVLIATPAYLHPEHFEAAVNARKHIFMEKPAAVDPAGVRRVQAAAKRADKTKRITVDYQQRYGKDYRRAHEIVQSGELGAIKMIRAAWMGGGPPIRTGHPQSEERMRNWFFYRELSGDILVEQDCHNIDVVGWFTGTHPVKVSGYGSQQIRKVGDIFDNLALTYQYPDGRVFTYAANQFRTPGFSDVSETFVCEKGAVNVSRRGYTIYRDKQEPETAVTKHDITMDAVNEFIEGARTGKIENAAFSAAESTLVAIMGLHAILKGREMTWSEISKA
jgi:myo-inositol 2-dehydrogenase / D-chiro-inositol 1-dehydrogenase